MNLHRWFGLFVCVVGCSTGGRALVSDTGVDAEEDAGIDAPDFDTAMDANPCPPGQVLRFDECILTPASCAGGEECQNDSCCVDGECIPFQVGPCGEFDDECAVPPVVGPFAPQLECEFESDGGSTHDVINTTMVGDFDLDNDASTVRPSIVYPTFSGVRVLDGATCEQQAFIALSNARFPTIGDINGDGRPELLTLGNIDGFRLHAYEWDVDAGEFVRLWSSTTSDGTPQEVSQVVSVHDLDDDGVPEVMSGSVVFSNEGVVRILSFGGDVFADVDNDGTIEMIGRNGIFEADFGAGEWVLEDYVPAGTQFTPRFVAVADFGDFGDGEGIAEIVGVGGGRIMISRITGERIFGPFDLPRPMEGSFGGSGGPPVVADLDGDGVPEVGVAGAISYTAYDMECDADPLPAGCSERGVRWQQPSQDLSSQATGSSVFDFEGDGRAEVVYADECFLRVYDGVDGRVKFSVARSSNTLSEYPVIADVDGDFNSEIVVGSNRIAFSSNCPDAHDPLFEGPSCSDACPSSLHECVDGVCRAPRQGLRGIQVYGDQSDLWVNSRPIWNQVEYHVSHVNDDGTIPRTSEWTANWLNPGLNNFRQNSQGLAGEQPAPDLTIRPLRGWACDGLSTQTFSVQVCNRGTEPVAPGVPVTFYAETDIICEGSRTAAILTPGGCEDVACAWSAAPVEPIDIVVVADDETAGTDPYNECREENNNAIFGEDSCDLI